MLAVSFRMILTDDRGLFVGGGPFNNSPLEILPDMVWHLGKLPEPYWSAWSQRSLHFVEEGNWPGRKRTPGTFWNRLLKVSNSEMDSDERNMFGSILREMVAYKPEKRITANELVASRWCVNSR